MQIVSKSRKIRTDYDVIIAGGGPAGASAAIHLASRGARVLLVEQKKFPRAKLCGEFISPECALHFQKLRVIDRMLAAQPAQLTRTVFYSSRGKSVEVPSAWFGGGVALGLSRAEMDERLLRRAGEAGVVILESTQVSNLILDHDTVCGVAVKDQHQESEYRAPIVIDATGRSRALTRHVQNNGRARKRASLIAFKAHLINSSVAAGACEIYFYKGGYGGLSSVEKGLSNLCFIASAADVRRSGADAERAVREVVCQNQRAAKTLQDARAVTQWLAVTLENFGRNKLSPAKGLLAIGDAASFIDPFTGSGMLMALESGELAAEMIAQYLSAGSSASFQSLSRKYETAYQRTFGARLRVCSLMRRAAFVPGMAELAVHLFAISSRLRHAVAARTRRPSSVQI